MIEAVTAALAALDGCEYPNYLRVPHPGTSAPPQEQAAAAIGNAVQALTFAREQLTTCH